VAQEGEKCIFMLCMEVAEEDMEVQEETVDKLCIFWLGLKRIVLVYSV